MKTPRTRPVPAWLRDAPGLVRPGDRRQYDALAAELGHKAPHAGVAAREVVLIDQVLPDGHGVAAAAEGQLNQLPVRLAGAGGRRPTAWRRTGEVSQARRRRAEVGGHRPGRFCQRVAPASGRAHHQPRGFQVRSGRLTPHARRCFNAAQRPAL